MAFFLIRHPCWIIILLVGLTHRTALASGDDPPRDAAPLSLIQKIKLPGVTAGVNHLAADRKRRRFFVTVPGAKRVVVVDLKSGRQSRTLSTAAAAACFIPDSNELCVAGGTGVNFFDAGSLAGSGHVDLGSGLDELRYSRKERRLYVGVMDAREPGIAAIDMAHHKLLSKLRLPAKPQGFAVEENGPYMYANTPAAGQVTVLNRKTGAIVGQWKLTGARSNYPVTLDEKNHRLFVGCRRPPRLLVLDTTSGKSVASVETARDADDMSFDPICKRIYLACGNGVITAVQQLDADHYRKLADTQTVSGARNGLLVPELRRLYLAVPRQGTTPAELWVFGLADDR